MLARTRSLLVAALFAACTSSTQTPAVDSGPADTGSTDTGAPDTGAQDTGGADTALTDTGTRDNGALDTGAPDTGRPDTGVADTGRLDTGVADTGVPDTGRPDTGVTDTGVDAGTRCDPTHPCRPYFCGCGRCDPNEISCVSDERVCPLACPLACPELATTVCACEGGACRVASTGPDGGSPDASGGGEVGAECTVPGDCRAGLLCCYPCGIPGCRNQCTEPDPRTGSCPLRP